MPTDYVIKSTRRGETSYLLPQGPWTISSLFNMFSGDLKAAQGFSTKGGARNYMHKRGLNSRHYTVATRVQETGDGKL